MTNEQLQDLSFTPGDYGWSAKLTPDSPRLFGKEVLLEIHTRSFPNDPKDLPRVSQSQAALVQALLPALPSLLQQAERELTAYNEKFHPDFHLSIHNPHIWLSNETDDGVSWTLVVGLVQNPDFGYHVEFQGTEFIELWSGD
jgi:hypothetical protein